MLPPSCSTAATKGIGTYGQPTMRLAIKMHRIHPENRVMFLGRVSQR